MLIFLVSAVLAAEPAGLSTQWISIQEAPSAAEGSPFRFGVDQKGRVWFGYRNGFLHEAATPANYRLNTMFDDFVWLANGEFVVGAGYEVGNAAPSARAGRAGPEGREERGLLEFKPALRLSATVLGIYPSGPSSLYLHVVEGGDSAVFWMDIGKKGQGQLVKIMDMEEKLSALAGDGKTTFSASGRRVMSVSGSGSPATLWTHPREDIIGLAYSPTAGLFFATPTRVGLVRDSKPYEIAGLQAGGGLRLQGQDLYVWSSGSTRVLRLRGAAAWEKTPAGLLLPLPTAETLEDRTAIAALRTEKMPDDKVSERPAQGASWNSVSSDEPPEPGGPPRKAIAAALIAVAFAVVGWMGFRHQRKSGLLAGARAKLKSSPQQAALDFLAYLRQGGSPEELSPDEVRGIYGLLEGEEAWRLSLKSTAPAWRRLLSVSLSLAQAHDQACALMSDEVLMDAARAERGLDGVLDVFERAGRLDEFLAGRLRGLHPDFHSALNAALTRRGRKSVEGASRAETPQEYSDGFRRKVGEGDFGGAKELFGRAELLVPIKDNPGLYYDFARLAERAGELPRAAEIYKKFIMADIVFKDALERFARLKEGTSYSGSNETAAAPISRGGALSGRYEIKSQLGMGGMGIVFMGYDRKLSRPVAIKKMRTDVQWDAQDRDRFMREAQLIAKLNHPYIVGIHEILDNGGDIHLVLDYVDGKPLSSVIRERGKLSLAEIRLVLDPVCQAIDYAHRNRVLHRDLKPSNIMVDVNGFAKVMDFGLARELKETMSRLSATAEGGGTLAYMAPEQHMGKSGKSVDVFALGVCLYEMATGSLPYPGPDYLAQKERRVYTPPQFLNAALPKEIEAVVAKILAPKPEERAAEAMDIMELLKSLP